MLTLFLQVDTKAQIFQAGYEAGQQANNATDAELSKAKEEALQQKKIAEAALLRLAEQKKREEIAFAKNAAKLKQVATKKKQAEEKAKKAAEAGKQKAEEKKQKEEKAKKAAEHEAKKLAEAKKEAAKAAAAAKSKEAGKAAEEAKKLGEGEGAPCTPPTVEKANKKVAVEKAKEAAAKTKAKEKGAKRKKAAQAARKKKEKAPKAAKKAKAEKQNARNAAEKANKAHIRAQAAASGAKKSMKRAPPAKKGKPNYTSLQATAEPGSKCESICMPGPPPPGSFLGLPLFTPRCKPRGPHPKKKGDAKKGGRRRGEAWTNDPKCAMAYDFQDHWHLPKTWCWVNQKKGLWGQCGGCPEGKVPFTAGCLPVKKCNGVRKQRDRGCENNGENIPPSDRNRRRRSNCKPDAKINKLYSKYGHARNPGKEVTNPDAQCKSVCDPSCRSCLSNSRRRFGEKYCTSCRPGFMFVSRGTNAKVGECKYAGSQGETKCNPAIIKSHSSTNRICTKSVVTSRHFNELWKWPFRHSKRKAGSEAGFDAECLLEKHVRCSKTPSGQTCVVTKAAQCAKVCYTEKLARWRDRKCGWGGDYDLRWDRRRRKANKAQFADINRSIKEIKGQNENDARLRRRANARRRRRSYVARRNLACSRKCWKRCHGGGKDGVIKATWLAKGIHTKYRKTLKLKPSDWCKDAIAIF